MRVRWIMKIAKRNAKIIYVKNAKDLKFSIKLFGKRINVMFDFHRTFAIFEILNSNVVQSHKNER